MSQEQKKPTFLGGAAVLAAGIVLVKIIGAIYKIPIVNVLGDGFADFNNAYYIYALLLTVSTAGLPVALSRMIAAANARGQTGEVRRIFRVSLGVFLLLGAVSFFVMFFGAGALAEMLGDPLAEKSIRVLAPAVVCVGCLSSFRGYAQGHGNMTPTAVSQILEATVKLIVGLGLAVLLVRMGRSDDVAAAGAIAGVTLGTMLSLLYMTLQYLRHRDRSPAQPAVSTDGAILRELLLIAVPITLTSSAFSVINLIDTSLVQGRLQDALHMSLQESRSLFSAYSGVMTLYNLPASLIVAVTASLIPAISAARARGEEAAASATVGTAFRVTALLVFPMGAGLSVLAKPIVRLLFPRLDAEVSGPLLSMLGVASVFVCLMTVSNSVLQAYGHERKPVYVMIAGGIIKIIVNYNLVAVPALNIKGAPIGTLCCFGFAMAADLYLIRRIVPEPLSWRELFAPAAAATGCMALVAYGAYRGASRFCGDRTAAVAAIVLAVAVYGVLALAFRLIRKEDLLLLPKGEKLAALLHL